MRPTLPSTYSVSYYSPHLFTSFHSSPKDPPQSAVLLLTSQVRTCAATSDFLTTLPLIFSPPSLQISHQPTSNFLTTLPSMFSPPYLQFSHHSTSNFLTTRPYLAPIFSPPYLQFSHHLTLNFPTTLPLAFSPLCTSHQRYATATGPLS